MASRVPLATPQCLWSREAALASCQGPLQGSRSSQIVFFLGVASQHLRSLESPREISQALPRVLLLREEQGA